MHHYLLFENATVDHLRTVLFYRYSKMKLSNLRQLLWYSLKVMEPHGWDFYVSFTFNLGCFWTLIVTTHSIIIHSVKCCGFTVAAVAAFFQFSWNCLLVIPDSEIPVFMYYLLLFPILPYSSNFNYICEKIKSYSHEGKISLNHEINDFSFKRFILYIFCQWSLIVLLLKASRFLKNFRFHP